jgi:TonB family protein
MNILLRRLGLSALPLLFFVPRLAAQEVTIGEPGWFESEGVPDTPPKSRRPLRPSLPRELRKNEEIGYVIVTQCLDARGQVLVLEARSEHPWYRRAVFDAFDDWKMAPAMLGGKPVNSWFWVSVIFNPASASADLPEATPRLLAVTPVIVSPAMMKKLRENTTAWGTVSLDSAGAPQCVALEAPASEKLLPFIDTALKHWRFAPARKGGQTVAADIRIPFLFYPPIPPVAGNQKPPRVIKQITPEYPYAMRQSGLVAEVTLSFLVNVKGGVTNPVVIQSNNPVFDQPAIAALLQWKFEPGTIDGQPMNTPMTVPIIFSFNGEPGTEAVSVTRSSRRQQAKIPEELRYDVAPNPRNYSLPVYPYSWLREGKTGKAIVLFQIGPQGRVTALKIAEAAQPEFGLALAAAAETYEFDPGLKGGHPVSTVLKTEKEFTTSRSDNLVVAEDLALLRREKKKPETIVEADRLDAPLKPLSRKAPVFPVAPPAEVDHGEAVIELLVDESGRARLPRIISATDLAFGYAAAQAVAQWLFEAPKCGGKATVARLRVPFEFKREPPVMGTGVGTSHQPANEDSSIPLAGETNHVNK